MFFLNSLGRLPHQLVQFAALCPLRFVVVKTKRRRHASDALDLGVSMGNHQPAVGKFPQPGIIRRQLIQRAQHRFGQGAARQVIQAGLQVAKLAQGTTDRLAKFQGDIEGRAGGRVLMRVLCMRALCRLWLTEAGQGQVSRSA